MLLEAKSQNFIGMEWKMNDLRMSILTWGKIQVRAFFGNTEKSRFGRCGAVTKPFLRLEASKTFKLFPES